MTVQLPSRSIGPSTATERAARREAAGDPERLEVPASLGAKLGGGPIGSARALREVLTHNEVAVPRGASDAEVARLAEQQRWPQEHQATVQKLTARLQEPASDPATAADPSRAAVAQRAHIASGQFRAHSLHRQFEQSGAVGAGNAAAGETRSVGTPPASAAPMSMAAAPGETALADEVSTNASDPEGARNNLEMARTLWREDPSDPGNIERLEKAIADATMAGKPAERDTHADNMAELARQMRQDAAEAKDKAERGEIPQEEADRLRDAAEEATVQAYEAKMGIEHDSPADQRTPDETGGDRGGDAGGDGRGGEVAGEGGEGGEAGREVGEVGREVGEVGGDFELEFAAELGGGGLGGGPAGGGGAGGGMFQNMLE